jgi:hypothetical protein
LGIYSFKSCYLFEVQSVVGALGSSHGYYYDIPALMNLEGLVWFFLSLVGETDFIIQYQLSLCCTLWLQSIHLQRKQLPVLDNRESALHIRLDNLQPGPLEQLLKLFILPVDVSIIPFLD